MHRVCSYPAAVVEALRQRQVEPQKELLIKNMPPITNYEYDPEKVFLSKIHLIMIITAIPIL